MNIHQKADLLEEFAAKVWNLHTEALKAGEVSKGVEVEFQIAEEARKLAAKVIPARTRLEAVK